MKKIYKTKFRIIMLFSIILSSFSINAQVMPNIDWVDNYSGRDTIDNSSTFLDANNNVYVTGYVSTIYNKDLIVIKYDSLGNLLWSNTYDNGGDDIGNAIKVDNSGNVVVTGVSYDATTQNDCITIKYNASGTQQWFKRFDLGLNLNDEAVDIKVDNTTGNIYITGDCNNGANSDFLVLKYSTNGGLGWVYTYNGVGNDYDAGVALVRMKNDNLFIAGNTTNGLGDVDIAVIKLDSSGAFQWSKFVAGNNFGNDYSSAIVLTGADVVVCGLINNTTTANDYTTFRLAGATGSIVWQQNYDTLNLGNWATSLVRDSTGNIAVTGLANNGSYLYDYHTILYDSTGTQKWIHKQASGLYGYYISPKIAVDTIAHHFYVSGAIQNSTGDVLVYQITPGGNTGWKKTYNGIGGLTDAATGIAVNSFGVVYLSSNCQNSSYVFYITTIKISQTPIYLPVDPLNEPPADVYSYTENKGQLLNYAGTSVGADTVQYYIENTQPCFFFKDNTMSFIYSRYDTIMATEDTIHKVDVTFYKSNPLSNLNAFTPLPTLKSYFLPGIPNNVITDVQSSRYLAIPNIYPSIDLIYYSNLSGFKYYFVVKPGGNPQNIIHKLAGASSTTVSTSGDLLISTIVGTLTLEKPAIYQVSYVSNTYSISPITTWTANWVNSGTNTYSFNLGAFSPTQALVFEIDQGNATVTASPPTGNTAWNTFIGGNRDDYFIDMEVDTAGYIYGLQRTNSKTYFAPINSYNISPLDLVNGALVQKFHKNGALLRTTYVGASGGVVPSAITVLSDSGIVLVGTATQSLQMAPSFTNPSTSYTSSVGSSFILKFANTTMTTVAWSTKIRGYQIDVDRNGNNDIYIVTRNGSSGIDAAYTYTKTNALNTSTINGFGCNAISRFDENGVPNWASYIPSLESGANSPGIKVDKKRNNYYVFGQTQDTSDFKHFNHYNTFLRPTKKSLNDAFIQKFTSGDTIIASTLYGGNHDDILTDAEILSNGQVCFVGYNQSNDYANISYNPADGSYFHVRGSAPTYDKGWIIKFDSLMNLKWAITHGDSAKDTRLFSVTRDGNDDIYIGGYGDGMDTTNSLPGAYFLADGTKGIAVLLMFNGINQFEWSTFMGSTWTPMIGGATAVCYNFKNNNLCFSGWGTAQPAIDYPWVPYTATTPNAWYTPYLYSVGYYDAMIGRFNLAGIVGIKENKKDKIDNTLFIYPNPTNDKVTINFGNKLTKPVKISVYNSVGQLVYYENIRKVDNINGTLDVSNLKAGIYFINLSSIEVNKTAKLIKE